MIEEIFARHGRVCLFYSGGKDALACLLLLRPYWDRTDVVWINTGSTFAEVREHMEKVRKIVPNFEEIRSNVDAYREYMGDPVDVVVLRNTAAGQCYFGKRKLKVCSAYDCCRANVWEPMLNYIRTHGVTCVVRGDRKSEVADRYRYWESTEFVFPIFDWTNEQVQTCLRTDGHGLVQERHSLENGSSLDCVGCMAGAFRGCAKHDYLKKHHPGVAQWCETFAKDYSEVVKKEINYLGGQ